MARRQFYDPLRPSHRKRCYGHLPLAGAPHARGRKLSDAEGRAAVCGARAKHRLRRRCSDVLFDKTRHPLSLFRPGARVGDGAADAAALGRAADPALLPDLDQSRAPSSMPIPITWAMRSITSICCASMKSCASRPRPRWRSPMFRSGPKSSMPWNGAATTISISVDDHFDMLEPSRFARPSPNWKAS